MKTINEQKVITAPTVSQLNYEISKHIEEGWQPKGSHKVVVIHEQLRYSGMQHKDTIIEREYSQTMFKYESNN